MQKLNNGNASIINVADALDVAWLSCDKDNPTICVNLTDAAIAWLESKGIEARIDGVGAGTDGMINSQLPVSCGYSQQYIGSDLMDDVLAKLDDQDAADEVREFISDLLDSASETINWREAEWGIMFDTENIEVHDNGLMHGYYDGSSLALLENLDTGEAYVTLELGPRDADYYAEEFKTFKSLDDAKAYIRSNIRDDETLQDFNITHRIWQDISGED